SEIEALTGPPPSVPSRAVRGNTDRGTVIPLREVTAARPPAVVEGNEERAFHNQWYTNQLIHRGPADERTNCHGWVFTGGRFWVPGDAVGLILSENGYQQVSDPQPGDLAVFHNSSGQFTHTAVVRYIAEGMPVLIEGKWGRGSVYLHPVDHSIYGKEFVY